MGCVMWGERPLDYPVNDCSGRSRVIYDVTGGEIYESKNNFMQAICACCAPDYLTGGGGGVVGLSSTADEVTYSADITHAVVRIFSVLPITPCACTVTDSLCVVNI